MGKVIAVDFDDVIFDCNATMAEFHNARYGTNYKVDEITTWDWAALWGVTKEEEYRRTGEYVDSDYHAGAPLIEGAHEGLTELKRLGYSIILVTSRGESIQHQTEAWMKKNISGLYDEVRYANQHEVDTVVKHSKADICREIGAGVLIEDAIHHTENVAGSGIPVLLFDQPWNRTETGTNVTRVKSWVEVVAWVAAHMPL